MFPCNGTQFLSCSNMLFLGLIIIAGYVSVSTLATDSNNIHLANHFHPGQLFLPLV